jgi:DNA-directed RNA polymerase I subunit RPA2
MERDALIAHGTSFLLQDRLMNCSDYSTAWVCRTCGSLISLGYDEKSVGNPGGKEYCRICDKEAGEAKIEGAAKDKDARVGFRVPGKKEVGGPRKGVMDVIAVPYVFRYVSWSFFSFRITQLGGRRHADVRSFAPRWRVWVSG